LLPSTVTAVLASRAETPTRSARGPAARFVEPIEPLRELRRKVEEQSIVTTSESEGVRGGSDALPGLGHIRATVSDRSPTKS
jgi:hypothetical protein